MDIISYLHLEDNFFIHRLFFIAFISMVQGQVEAYRVDFMDYPTIQDLVEKGYLKKNETTCPNKEEIMITKDGEVRLAKTSTNTGSSN